VNTTFEFKGRVYRRMPVSNGRFGAIHGVASLGPAALIYKAPPAPTDPVELIVHRALVAAEVPFTTDPRLTLGLDFKLLTEPAIYIECKQFHSPRITEQMSRAKDVIAVQGIEAAHFFAGLFK